MTIPKMFFIFMLVIAVINVVLATFNKNVHSVSGWLSATLWIILLLIQQA